jgi:hypothetical protein
MPYICYVDEAGCATPLPANSKTDIQPLLVIAGLLVPQNKVGEMTRTFLNLKRRYFPGHFNSPHYLDDIRDEIKGADIRSAIRKRGPKASAQLKFADEVLALLKTIDARLIASIWIKGLGKPFKDKQAYTASVQAVCRHFESALNEKDEAGMVIADFRTTQLNDRVAHSIFTQKYRAKGDPFSRILELPSFGVSNNHAGLQITDLLCTTLLYPMASATYCRGHIQGVHVSRYDSFIKRRYMRRIKALQFQSLGANNKAAWSVWVADAIQGRTSRELFQMPPPLTTMNTPP